MSNVSSDTSQLEFELEEDLRGLRRSKNLGKNNSRRKAGASKRTNVDYCYEDGRRKKKPKKLAHSRPSFRRPRQGVGRFI